MPWVFSHGFNSASPSSHPASLLQDVPVLSRNTGLSCLPILSPKGYCPD